MKNKVNELEVKNRLKELRTKENLSQAELAQKSGVSQNLIARLESGALTNTTTDTLFKISKALNVKVEQIFFTDNV